MGSSEIEHEDKYDKKEKISKSRSQIIPSGNTNIIQNDNNQMMKNNPFPKKIDNESYFGNNSSKINGTTTEKNEIFAPTYSENELTNKLNNFMETLNFQDRVFDVSNGTQDPVFDAINENQKKILIDYFLKI